MIKHQNGDLSRTPLPAFLQGLLPESLRDLSWTDPALGVQDCAWLLENDASEPLQQYQRYGAETLTLGDNVVIVTRAVVPWSAQEIAADVKSRVPQAVTMRQARLALLGAGLLASVDAAIAVLSEPVKSAALIEWEYGGVVQRNAGLVPTMAGALGMTDIHIDALFTQAATL